MIFISRDVQHREQRYEVPLVHEGASFVAWTTNNRKAKLIFHWYLMSYM